MEIFELSDETYGYRRIHAALRRCGHACSPELVRALVGELGLQPCQPRAAGAVHPVVAVSEEDMRHAEDIRTLRSAGLVLAAASGCAFGSALGARSW